MPASWFGLGELARQLGAPPLAAEYYAEAARAEPGASDPRKQLGLMRALQGDFEGAVRDFGSGGKAEPDRRNDPAQSRGSVRTVGANSRCEITGAGSAPTESGVRRSARATGCSGEIARQPEAAGRPFAALKGTPQA